MTKRITNDLLLCAALLTAALILAISAGQLAHAAGKTDDGSGKMTAGKKGDDHMTTELKTGDTAPQFNLKSNDGRNYMLGDYKGKWVVLYFYPKDDTPGCTK